MILETATDREYRAMPEYNYSKLKDFDSDPRKFYRKHILGEKVEDKLDAQEKESIRHGNIIDCLLTCEQEFDHRYQIIDLEVPTGQMGDFVNHLYKLTVEHTDAQGKLYEEMDTLYAMAYKLVGFKRDTIDVVKENFVLKGMKYYKALRERGDKIVLTQTEYEKCCYLVEKLRVHPVSGPLINRETDDRFNVHTQLALTGMIDGLEMKCLLDKIIIDEEKMIVHPIDYKTTANGSLFRYNYRKLAYYLQLAVYTKLTEQNYPGYTVMPLRFAVFDRTLYNDPVIFRGQQENVKQAMEGFTHEGRYYNGLSQVIDNLKYTLENQNWTTPREFHEKKGIVNLEIY